MNANDLDEHLAAAERSVHAGDAECCVHAAAACFACAECSVAPRRDLAGTFAPVAAHSSRCGSGEACRAEVSLQTSIIKESLVLKKSNFGKLDRINELEQTYIFH